MRDDQAGFLKLCAKCCREDGPTVSTGGVSTVQFAISVTVTHCHHAKVIYEHDILSLHSKPPHEQMSPNKVQCFPLKDQRDSVDIWEITVETAEHTEQRGGCVDEAVIVLACQMREMSKRM